MTRGEIGQARGDGEGGGQTRKIIRERRGEEKLEEGRVETREIDERSGE